jgi:hypothetical protein
MFKIIALSIVHVTCYAASFFAGYCLAPHNGEQASAKVEAFRVTHVLPESRDLTTTRPVSF